VSQARTPADVLSTTDLVTVTWALDFLRALALLAGVIVAAGLLLYLAARQRRRMVSYVLGRRLGLGRRAHLASLLVELAAALGLGWLLGLVGGLVSVWLVNPIFDVNAGYPPGSTVSYPVVTIVGATVTLAVVALVCALSAQYTADRTSPAEITRIGT
jgi:putative ABC transport system permease protein